MNDSDAKSPLYDSDAKSRGNVGCAQSDCSFLPRYRLCTVPVNARQVRFEDKEEIITIPLDLKPQFMDHPSRRCKRGIKSGKKV